MGPMMKMIPCPTATITEMDAEIQIRDREETYLDLFSDSNKDTEPPTIAVVRNHLHSYSIYPKPSIDDNTGLSGKIQLTNPIY